MIVGGSTTGKTALAYSLASLTDAVVVCGDQWQLVDGFPVATGIADAARHNAQREFYGCLSPTSHTTLTAQQYGERLDGLLVTCDQSRLVIIDSLSLAYFPILRALRHNHHVVVIGLQPHWMATPLRVIARMWQAWRDGALAEIRRGARAYGQQSWYIRRSFVAQDLLRHGMLLGGLLVLWKGLTGEAIQGKHRRIVASGEVDCWL